MLTEADRAEYARMLDQRVPIDDGEVVKVRPVCNGRMRRGELLMRYQGGAETHYFRHACDEEIAFQALQLKAMGISL